MNSSNKTPNTRHKMKLNCHLSSVICYLIVCLSFTISSAQVNLVPNPGFESLEVNAPCWNSGSKYDFEAYIENWFAPNNGTADIFSTGLSSQCLMSLPHSTEPLSDWLPRGTQMPRTGNRVTGIKTLPDERREYLSVELNCALIPGEQYYAEMYVCLSEQTNYAQNNLGMYFSDTMIYVNSFNYLPYTPQILETGVVSDSINWVKISGTFTAASPAKYLLIGCFSKRADNNVLYLGNKGNIEFSYYYVDDVLVHAVNIPAPSITITGDTILCRNDTLTLTASSTEDITWYNASGNVIASDSVLKLIPTTSTYYEARSSNCYATSSKTQNIIVYEPVEIDLGNDTLICNGTQLTLEAPGVSNHFWQLIPSDPPVTSTDPTFAASLAGQYLLEATDINGCETNASIQVGFYPTPFVNLGPDLLTCEINGTFNVAAQDGISYMWNDGSTNAFYNYNGEGTYWVSLSGICGTQASDTITISEIHMFIPNLITANDDGKNDILEVQGIETGKGELNIYNRFGSRIFSEKSYSGNWKAFDITEGIYFYEFNYPGCSVRKGWVQVMK
jgi:hypothetical protein